jgi:hypothetical protein
VKATTLKFKRLYEGEYEVTYKGYVGEISKNYESRNWSWSVNGPDIREWDVVPTYRDAKEMISNYILGALNE